MIVLKAKLRGIMKNNLIDKNIEEYLVPNLENINTMLMSISNMIIENILSELGSELMLLVIKNLKLLFLYGVPLFYK